MEVVFDIETTGLDIYQDRIVELSAVKLDGYNIIDTFDELINPGIIIPSEAIAVHGITNEMVKAANYPGVVLTHFMKFIDGATSVIGHNAIRFDYPFLIEECKRNMIKMPKITIRDTMRMAAQKIPRKRWYSLSNLCEYFGVVNESAHRALGDVHATAEIYLKLKEM